MKISAVCPVCHVTLSWEDTQTELWGHIDALDVGCVSVTRGYDPLVEEHLNAHRLDGSFMAALSKHYERLRTNAEGFLARFPARCAVIPGQNRLKLPTPLATPPPTLQP